MNDPRLPGASGASSASSASTHRLRTDLRSVFNASLMPKPDVMFVLFGRGRSGSTLLVELLDSLPRVVCEGEILSEHRRWPLSYVRARAANARRGGAMAFGFKLLTYQVRSIGEPSAFLSTLDAHDIRIVHLRRRDVLRHALSNMRARQLDSFHQRGPDAPPLGPIEVDVDDLQRWMAGSVHADVIEQDALRGLRHLSLEYETDLLDPASHQPTVDRVCGFLGIESAPCSSSVTKASPRSLDELVTNPADVRRVLRGTEFEQFI